MMHAQTTRHDSMSLQHSSSRQLADDASEYYDKLPGGPLPMIRSRSDECTSKDPSHTTSPKLQYSRNISMSATVQDVIVLFGDSITQGAWTPGLLGYGEQLTHVYARKLDVLNRGLSGYNTDWASPIFRRILATREEREYVPKIRLLVIWFGANDSCIKPSPQHVPLEKFAANLKEWVDIIHSPGSQFYSPETRIILITPPPVNTYQRRADLESRDPVRYLDRDFELTRRYAEAVKDVAREKKVPVTDIWTALWEAAGKDEQSLSRFMYDGLHLNAEGYKILYELLVATIKEHHPEVHFDNLPEAFPPWLVHAEQASQN